MASLRLSAEKKLPFLMLRKKRRVNCANFNQTMIVKFSHFCPWDKKLKGFISLFVRETIFLSQRYIKGEITEIRKVLCFVIQYRGGFWGWILALIDNGTHSYYCISQISQELLWLKQTSSVDFKFYCHWENPQTLSGDGRHFLYPYHKGNEEVV